jgi:hypothetical protein
MNYNYAFYCGVGVIVINIFNQLIEIDWFGKNIFVKKDELQFVPLEATNAN